MSNYEITGKNNEEIGPVLKVLGASALVALAVASTQSGPGFSGHDHAPAPTETPIAEEDSSEINLTGDYTDLISKYIDGVEIAEENEDRIGDFFENGGITTSDSTEFSPPIEPLEGTDFAVDDSQIDENNP